MPKLTSLPEYLTMLSQPALREGLSPLLAAPYIAVDLTEVPSQERIEVSTWLPPCPTIAWVNAEQWQTERSDSQLTQAAKTFDLIVENPAQLETLVDAIEAQPLACSTLAGLLRHNQRASVQDGLFAESLAYSTLQHSQGFKVWIDGRQRPQLDTSQSAVLADENGGLLTLTLNRPQVHNAYSSAMRDTLCEYLSAAQSRLDLEEIHIRGAGPSFCAGGDLKEFGLAVDAGNAHLSRMTRSAGALLSQLQQKTRAHLHGACIGAGIELPAFMDEISAKSDTFFQLPEINMGLVPGAGGTVSILRRIGLQRTAWMAISGARISASQALAWGLIDRIED